MDQISHSWSLLKAQYKMVYNWDLPIDPVYMFAKSDVPCVIADLIFGAQFVQYCLRLDDCLLFITTVRVERVDERDAILRKLVKLWLRVLWPLSWYLAGGNFTVVSDIRRFSNIKFTTPRKLTRFLNPVKDVLRYSYQKFMTHRCMVWCIQCR